MNYAGFSIEYSPNRVLAAATITLFNDKKECIEEKSRLFRPSIFYHPNNLFARDREGFETVKALMSNPFNILAFYRKTYSPKYNLAKYIGEEFYLPTFSIADNLGSGSYSPLPKKSGFFQPVYDGKLLLCYALRTQPFLKPVYLTIGNDTKPQRVIPLTFSFIKDSRIPEIVRQARNKSKQTLREHLHDLL